MKFSIIKKYKKWRENPIILFMLIIQISLYLVSVNQGLLSHSSVSTRIFWSKITVCFK